MTLLNKIYNYSITNPSDIAIITSEHQITYKEFFNNILKCSTIIQKYNLKKGSIVIYENTQDEYFCYIFFALNLLKLIALPVDKQTPEIRIKEIKEMLDAKLILPINDIKKNLSKAKEYSNYELPNLEDSCLLLLSSGSTGKEKCIEYTNNTIYNIVDIYKDLYQLEKASIILPTGPICRAYSITRLFIAFNYGISLYIYNSSDIVDLLSIIDKYQKIILSTNPTIIHYLLALFKDKFTSSIKNIHILESCTAPLNQEDAIQLKNILQNTNTQFYNFYGATELQIAYLDIKKYGFKKGCVGLPLKDTIVEILDENNNVIQSSSSNTGKIRVYNTKYSANYYKEAPLKYFNTGEIGYIENDLLYIVDRTKNFFNINGYKLSPREIEEVTLKCPGILESVCYYKDTLTLDIVVKQDFDIEKLKQILNEHLPKYKIPKKINEVDKLFKTPNGKIDYKKYC